MLFMINSWSRIHWFHVELFLPVLWEIMIPNCNKFKCDFPYAEYCEFVQFPDYLICGRLNVCRRQICQ